MIQSMWTNLTTNLLRILSTWINRNSMCCFLTWTFFLFCFFITLCWLVGSFTRFCLVKCLFRFVSLHSLHQMYMYYFIHFGGRERERAKKNHSRIEYLSKCEFPLWLIFSLFFFMFVVFADGCKWGLLTHNARYCPLSSLSLICKAFVQIK